MNLIWTCCHVISLNKGMPAGVARKVSFFFILVSAIGWICFDVGLGMEGQSEKGTLLQWNQFCRWCFAVSGLLLYMFYIIHLLANHRISAVLTLVLLPVFLVSAGGVLNSIGTSGLNHDTRVYYAAEFAGVGLAVVMLWIALILWPFYAGEEDRYGRLLN